MLTSDSHSGFDRGFTYGGIYEVRYQMELKGDTVLLVDSGDAIQGAPLGKNTKGEYIIKFMNEMGYEVAVPGEHEFHYGVDRFLELREHAKYEYICCNFLKDGQPVMKPYIIREVLGKQIAFVGVTTPKTLAFIPPEYFKNEAGDFVYSFMQEDGTGMAMADAVQDAINKAKGAGADYVVVMGHLGNDESCAPWNYQTLLSRIQGCDVYLDGYTHDYAVEEAEDASGKKIPRINAGANLHGIGWVRISGENGKITTGVYTWQDKRNPMELFDIENPMTKKVRAVQKLPEAKHQG